MTLQKNGIGSHQSQKMLNDEWLTPPEILQALGEFDLDPCSPINRPWPTAKEHFTIEDDGLSKKWKGRVFMNPPYGKYTDVWLNKLAGHGNGIALIFARTETKMFHRHVWNKATALFFLEGRLFFYDVNGQKAKHNGGAPSVLIAYGSQNAYALKHSGLKGKYINLTTTCSRSKNY